MEKSCSSFKPILDKNTIALFIGTIPSEESLNQDKYYAHKNNQFWPFIKEIFGIERYDYKALLARKIGLWDVLSSCTRKGSSDNSIKNQKYNDFSKYPQIKYYFFTSKNAYNFFIKNKTNQALLEKNNSEVLPSPSSAYARMSREEKKKKWQKILKDF